MQTLKATQMTISISGFLFNLANGPISWVSRKHKTIALPSTKMEYMSS
jgi:hypothetical protein